MREIVEDTLDWFTALCGIAPGERGPRNVRAAIRHLDNPLPALRARAEQRLRAAHPQHVAPLLHRAARSRVPLRAAQAVALLAHIQDEQGAELLHHLISQPLFREGEHGEKLAQLAQAQLSPDQYARQAAASLALVEQRPDSCRAIARFRQATELLRFLDAPLAPELLDRALVVRTIGGENLSLARQILRGEQETDVEHVCLVRKEAALMLLHHADRAFALHRLMQIAAYPNPAVQLTALHGLDKCCDPRAISALLPIAQDEASPIREDALELIARLGRGASAALTLMRASSRTVEMPAEMLRPARPCPDPPQILLRPRSLFPARPTTLPDSSPDLPDLPPCHANNSS